MPWCVLSAAAFVLSAAVLAESVRNLKNRCLLVGLFPPPFASNRFYTYYYKDVNLPYFKLRVRGLDNVLCCGMQIAGACNVSCLLGVSSMGLTMHAKGALL